MISDRDYFQIDTPKDESGKPQMLALDMLFTQNQPVFLEIGCGEGHQSVHLATICDRLIGIDVSPRAVERARMRCANGEFLVGDAFSAGIGRGPFDLVVACEVLYYSSNVNAFLNRMRQLGQNGLVTYYVRELAMLDPEILRIPDVALDMIEFNSVRWRVAWWH